jgi:hypothetical protein
MNIEEMKRKLKSYTEKQIILKEHTMIRCIQREITREMIVRQLLNPENLIDVIEQESKYSGEKKYKLVFELSRNKSFIIVVSINKIINTITVLIRYRKWVRPLELRKRR